MSDNFKLNKATWRENYYGHVCDSFSRELISNENCFLDLMNSDIDEAVNCIRSAKYMHVSTSNIV